VYEEVEFVLFGHTADVAMADGGFINIVTKSGGNVFHGGAVVEYFNDKMAVDILSPEGLSAVGLEKPIGRNSWQDFSFSLGGPILRDRFWFFINGRYFAWEQNFNLVSWDKTLLSKKRIFEFEKGPHKEINAFTKLTFQIRPNLRVVAMYNLAGITEDFYTQHVSSHMDRTATSRWDGEIGHTLSAQMNWGPEQNFFLDIRIGYNDRYFPLPFSEYALADAPLYWDRYWEMYRNNTWYEETYTRRRFNPSITATYFNDGFLGVSQELKFGVEYERASSQWDWWRANPYCFEFFDGSIYAEPTSASPNRGIISVYTCGSEQSSSVEKDEKDRFGAFVQDSISLSDRLTLSLGIRFDTSTGRYPRQEKAVTADPYGIFAVLPGLSDISPYSSFETERQHVLTWTHFSPRIGFSYDLLGDGTTSLRGSWSRYNEYLMLQYFNRMNPIYPRLGSWYWYDDNYNQIPDPSDRFKIRDLPDSPYGLDLIAVLDPDSSAPYTDEFTLGIEKELARDFSAGITLIYKHKQNIFEDVNDYGLGKQDAWMGYSPQSPYWEKFEFQDPGDDGLFGTDDDKMSFCYAELADSPGDLHWYYTNVNMGFRKYAAIQFILNKRMSRRWQLLASFVWSKTWGNIGGSYFESSGASEAFDTPNSSIFPRGRLDYDRPLNIKIQSTVILPANIVLSGYFNHLSGYPWARTVMVFIPEDDRYLHPGQSYKVPTEEIGTRRKDSLTTLDLRVEKIFRLKDSMTLGGYLDVLNLLGWSAYDIAADPGGYVDYRNPEKPVFSRYGNYGTISGAYGTRIFKLSLRFSF
ncbi:MAG: TonB-dependent receptor, partial [Candidatus Aminicenantes bacterium]|nr:TonB-dependent receptor [Candidatus Aminicenantes bacterium]